jgi:hypothetical protein
VYYVLTSACPFLVPRVQLQLSKQGSTIWPFVLWKFLNKGADPPMNWEDMLPGESS